MAQICIGNVDTVDRGTLEALARLPDDFAVLAEFRLPRTTCGLRFVVARVGQSAGALTLIEVLNEARRLSGTVDGVWQVEDELRPGTWRTLTQEHDRQVNPLQQAVANAAALRDWIVAMQPLLQRSDPPWPDLRENLTVAPRLVLPYANPHNRLQANPEVARDDSIDALMDGLTKYRGRRSFPVSQGMIDRMAEYLGHREWPSSGESEQVRRLSAQISALQRDVTEVKRLLGVLTSGQPLRPANSEPVRPAAERPVASTEREAALDLLASLIRELRGAGQSRVFANVNEEVRQRFGELPNDRVPYERFKDFVQDAQRRGKIRLVRVGPVDHVLLPDEPIQPYVESVRREAELAPAREE
ncbi:MAG: hypothetical protein U0556_14245 [Dehalococcoidia bacterium]